MTILNKNRRRTTTTGDHRLLLPRFLGSNKITLKHGFWLLLIFYLIAVFWSYKTVTELDHHNGNNAVVVESPSLPAANRHRHQHQKHNHHQQQKVRKPPPPSSARRDRDRRDGKGREDDLSTTTKDKKVDEAPESIHHNNTIVIREAVTITGDNDNNNNSNSTTTTTTTTSTTIHVLILISSVMRKHETICTTIKYALENFLPNNEGDYHHLSSSMSMSSSFVVRTPHILLHRYGEFPSNNCNFSIMSPSASSSISSFVTMEQYSKHMHPNNQQQIIDYLHLMDHGIQFINEWNNANSTITKSSTQQQQQQQSTTIPPFTHVMFLDDDVKLCPGFCYNILNAIQAFPSTFGMGHFGRGGSGLLIPSEELPSLREKMIVDQSRLKTQPKNVDSSIIEFGLSNPQTCIVRPTTIQMLHIGFESSMNRKQRWKDIDQCYSPADNVNWKALSESPHPYFFGEHCLYNPSCSPFTSSSSSGIINNCSLCQNGYTGDDCGLHVDDVSSLTRRTMNIPPIVSLLDSNKYQNEDVIIQNSKRHSLINLYVLGNKMMMKNQQNNVNTTTTTTGWWLESNIYISPNNASFAFHEELKRHPRWGELAWPKELILIYDLIPPEELWSLKYYEPIINNNKKDGVTFGKGGKSAAMIRQFDRRHNHHHHP